MFRDKCPTCGTIGKLWHKEPEVFICPNCSSVFSRFGVVFEHRERESRDFHS